MRRPGAEFRQAADHVRETPSCAEARLIRNAHPCRPRGLIQVCRAPRSSVGSPRCSEAVRDDFDMAEDCDRGAVVTTDRLVVRRWGFEEIDRFFDSHRRPEVVHWLPAEPMQDRRDATEMIERNIARAQRISVGLSGLVDRASGVPVGCVILKELPEGHGEVEIGWQPHPDSWGRGFATEAAWRRAQAQPRRRPARDLGDYLPQEPSVCGSLPTDRDAAARMNFPRVPRAPPDVLGRVYA